MEENQNDTVHVDVLHRNCFGNSCVLLSVMSRDTAAAAAFVHALDDLLCVPASLNDLVPAATLQFPSEFPSAAAGADT